MKIGIKKVRSFKAAFSRIAEVVAMSKAKIAGDRIQSKVSKNVVVLYANNSLADDGITTATTGPEVDRYRAAINDMLAGRPDAIYEIFQELMRSPVRTWSVQRV